MDAIDQKIRKQWLAVWLFSLCLGFLNGWWQMKQVISLGMPPIAGYASMGASIMILSLYAWISYRCIYKKPGTKLLSFFIVLTAVSLAATPVLYFSGRLYVPTHIPYYSAFYWVSQLAGIVWFIACWRMRKTNKKLKAALQPI